jgi:hypothetical protein
VLADGVTSVDLSGICRKGNLPDGPPGDPDAAPIWRGDPARRFPGAHQ